MCQAAFASAEGCDMHVLSTFCPLSQMRKIYELWYVPVAGQGLSLAVEDAVVLAWHLRQQGLGEPALRRYSLCPRRLYALTSMQPCNHTPRA